MNLTITSELLSSPHVIELQPEESHSAMVTLPDGTKITFEADATNPALFWAILESGERVPVYAHVADSTNITLSLRGYTYKLQALTEREQFYSRLLKDSAGPQSSIITLKAPMPGLIKSVSVEVGKHVRKGERLFILEAMKMENDIKSPIEGIVTKVQTKAGEAVEKNAHLCVIEPVKAS